MECEKNVSAACLTAGPSGRVQVVAFDGAPASRTPLALRLNEQT